MSYVMLCAAALLLSPLASPAVAQERQMERVPDRRSDEGAGPFRKLVIRGATLIDGTGAPPRGPVDIVIEGNRIASVSGVGTPGLPLEGNRGPHDAVQEIDATGMYVMP